MQKNTSARLLVALAPLFILAFVSACDSMPSWLGGEEKKKEKLPGDRIAVLPSDTQLEPDKTLESKPMSLPAARPNTDWAQHTDVVASDRANLAGGSFDHMTQAKAGEGDAFEHLSIPRPVVAGGVVYVMDAVGNVSAHSASDIGHVNWQSKGVSEDDEPQILGGGLAFDSGTLYIVSGRGVVAALDASTGRAFWKKSLRIPFRSSPKVADGKLFATSIDNQIYAISTASGEVLWSQRGINETAGIMNSVSPAMAGETLIVPFSSGEIYALSPSDGHELWNDSISAVARTQASASFAGIGGDPVVDNSVVFAVSAGGMMSAVSVATGQHAWNRPVGSFNTPWVAGDTLFVLTTDNTLVAMEKFTARIRWATQLQNFANVEEKKDPITWHGPVLVDGRLAVVGSNGELLLVSAQDGKIASTVTIPEEIYTSPVVVNGVMYLVSKDATLYALQ